MQFPDLQHTPLEGALSQVGVGPIDPNQVARNHDAILKMTAELFPGAKIELGRSIDPETEGDEYFVVSVTTAGEIRELVEKDGLWHQRLWDVAPDAASNYRLLMDVA
jgi:hypothetical protein